MQTKKQGARGGTPHPTRSRCRRLVFIGGLGVFAIVWATYAAGLLGEIDSILLHAIAIDADRHAKLAKTFVEWTALGSLAVLALITIGAVAILAAIGERRRALFFLVTVLASWSASQILKAAIARARPDLFDHLVTVSTKSLPSGHAMMSLVVYGALALMVSPSTALGRARRAALMMALLLAALIGTSRVLLAVHWPSDVIAGWALGAAALALAAPWLDDSASQAAGRS